MGTKCTVFSSDKGDIKADLAFFNNYNGATAPGVSNDTTQGYRRGSRWQNQAVTPVAVYECTSDTAGAAVWQLLESAGAAEGQIVAPAASTPTGTGGAASVTGGTGGTTSGAGGASSTIGGAATAGNSAGGAANETGGAGSGSAAGGAATVTGGVGGATGAGGASSVVGGAGGATSGTGGTVAVTGGAGSAGNANGGDVTIAGGAPNGSGVAGVIRENGVILRQQGAPDAEVGSVTLTAAALLTGIINGTPVGAANYTLPLQTAMDTALPTSVAGDAFDFSIINTSGGANTITVLANSWTLVGAMTIAQNVSARMRARKTGAGAWTLYRLA